jgi:hypothetical protein
VVTEQSAIARKHERTDLVTWSVLVIVGSLLTLWAVKSGLQLGTAGAPFLGRYRVEIGYASVLAVAIAVSVLTIAYRGWFDRASFRRVLIASYLGMLAWATSLAIVDGASGFTRALLNPDSYLSDVTAVGDDPFGYLSHFTANAAEHSIATRGHPPAPVLLLWLAQQVGLTDHLGLVVTAVGALCVPFTLSAMRDACGEQAARRIAPLFILATSAVWLAVSMDAVTAAVAAAMLAAGCRATRVHGWAAGGWALLAGALLGVAALFSYAAAWLGLSVVCFYFARRRAALITASGIGVLIPVLLAWAAGFSWMDGLLSAHEDFTARVDPVRPALPWAAISVVALLLAAGPGLVASLRKARNTPGWPFLVGAGAAVVFSIGAGLARGGVEHAWLPYFAWLCVAATAPEKRGGPPPPVPLLLTAVGALTAIVVEAVLATPW